MTKHEELLPVAVERVRRWEKELRAAYTVAGEFAEAAFAYFGPEPEDFVFCTVTPDLEASDTTVPVRSARTPKRMPHDEEGYRYFATEHRFRAGSGHEELCCTCVFGIRVAEDQVTFKFKDGREKTYAISPEGKAQFCHQLHEDYLHDFSHEATSTRHRIGFRAE